MRALVVAAAALTVGLPPAQAQEWTSSIGGFMTIGVGYVDAGAHNAEVEIVNNAEVTFDFRLTADNGLTFGGRVEFEANGSDENADTYVASIDGPFGTLEIGSEDGAGDRLLGVAAGYTAFTAAADATGLLFDYADAESPGVVATDGGDTDDALKVTYFTPVFSGFQAGVSYAANATDGPTSTDGSNGIGEALEFGAAYNRELGDVSLALGGMYVLWLDDGDLNGLDDAWGVSANLGYAGFTVGGIFGQQNGDDSAADDGGWGVGVDYSTGPWRFGVQYAQGIDASDDIDGFSVGVDYALAPGVTVGAIGEYAGNDDEASAPAGDDDAFAFGVFTDLAF